MSHDEAHDSSRRISAVDAMDPTSAWPTQCSGTIRNVPRARFEGRCNADLTFLSTLSTWGSRSRLRLRLYRRFTKTREIPFPRRYLRKSGFVTSSYDSEKNETISTSLCTVFAARVDKCQNFPESQQLALQAMRDTLYQTRDMITSASCRFRRKHWPATQSIGVAAWRDRSA